MITTSLCKGNETAQGGVSFSGPSFACLTTENLMVRVAVLDLQRIALINCPQHQITSCPRKREQAYHMQRSSVPVSNLDEATESCAVTRSI